MIQMFLPIIRFIVNLITFYVTYKAASRFRNLCVKQYEKYFPERNIYENVAVVCGDTNNDTFLHFIASYPDVDTGVMKKWIGYGMKIALNRRNHYGRTPLHSATEHRYFDKMYALLEMGADPTIQDFEGNTFLHELSWRNFHSNNEHGDILQELASKYPEAAAIKNYDGKTYLDMAGSICYTSVNPKSWCTIS